MRPRPSLLAGLGLSFACLVASAQAVKAGDIAIVQPYARATAAGQPAGGAYLRLENAGAQADRLVSARADVARSVELHHMQMDGDVMRMRQVEAIDVPAKGTVELKPGGLHLMLMGLKSPLKEGERVRVTLKFQNAGEVKVDFAVQGVKAPEPGSHERAKRHDHAKP